MGNSVFSNGAVIAIQIDNNYGEICSGSTIRGTVFLDVQKESITADSLNIALIGEEHTKVSYQVQQHYTEKNSEGVEVHKTRTVTEYAYDKAIIIDIDRVLNVFGGQCRNGRYQYPFEIQVPNGLPGRQGSRDNSRSDYFCIEYHLEARLHRNGIFTWDVKNRVEILMNDQPFPYERTPLYVEPSVRNISFLCCIPSGTMTLGVKMDSAQVAATDTLRVNYEIINKSTSRIKALEVHVDEILSFRAHGHSRVQSARLYSQRIELAQLLATGLKAEPDKGIEAITPQEWEELAERLKAGQHGINVMIPDFTRSDFNGNLGTVRHNVSVTIRTPFCVSDPEVAMPLGVYGSKLNFSGVQPAVAEAYALPADWQASVAPLVKVDMVTEPSAPPTTGSSLTHLVALLQASSERGQASALAEWLSVTSKEELVDPKSFNVIFTQIKGPTAYASLPSVLSRALPDIITCAHVAQAITPINDAAIKVNVANAFSRVVVDTCQNARDTFIKQSGLSPYNIDCIAVNYI